MLSTPSNKRLLVTEEEFKKVREIYGVSKEAIDANIDNVVEWFRLQPHLPDVELDRGQVERIFIGQKCSTQRTKIILDLRYTCKHVLPEIFLNRDTRSPSLMETFDSTYCIPLPKLCPDLTRVMVLKIKNEDTDSFSQINLILLVSMIQEIRFNEDYPLGVRYILDLENVRVGHVIKCSPVIAAKFNATMRKVQGFRLFGVHIVNGNKIAERVVALFKQFASPKLAERIAIESTYEDLHKSIPRSVLPKDYGGEGESLDAIAYDWKTHVTSNEIRNYFIEQDKYTSDETRRPKDSLAGDFVAVQGSFKNLNID